MQRLLFDFWIFLLTLSIKLKALDEIEFIDLLGLLEEIADAYICLSFLESIFDVKPEDLQKAIDVKLQRERENCR